MATKPPKKTFQNKNAEDHAHRVTTEEKTTKDQKEGTHRHQTNLVFVKFNKNHVLAQEVNYIEWRFKVGQKFWQQKHFSGTV